LAFARGLPVAVDRVDDVGESFPQQGQMVAARVPRNPPPQVRPVWRQIAQPRLEQGDRAVQTIPGDARLTTAQAIRRAEGLCMVRGAHGLSIRSPIRTSTLVVSRTS